MSNITEDHMQLEALKNLAYEKGFEYEKKYSQCSQCCVAAISEIFNFDPVLIKASYLLSGGLAQCGRGTCGALSGASLVVSSLFGRSRNEFESFKDKKALNMMVSIQNKFEDKYGSIVCRGVQTSIFGRSYDFFNENDKAQFRADGGHVDKCTDVVGSVTMWLAEELWQAGIKPAVLV